jgi:hypothetical protein
MVRCFKSRNYWYIFFLQILRHMDFIGSSLKKTSSRFSKECMFSFGRTLLLQDRVGPCTTNAENGHAVCKMYSIYKTQVQYNVGSKPVLHKAVYLCA